MVTHITSRLSPILREKIPTFWELLGILSLPVYHPRMRRLAPAVLALALALPTALIMSACTVSITADEPAPGEEIVVDENGDEVFATDEATPDASEQAEIDQEFYDFCVIEAQNNVDFVGTMGDLASLMIADGMQQSIDQQGMNETQAESCRQAWIDVMAEAGIDFVDPNGAAAGDSAGDGSGDGSGDSAPAASPAAS